MLGDCLEQMKSLEDDSVDSVICDPPYGLSFMGKRWDYDVPSVEIWAECLRVLKPGGHLLAFAGTRTQHRMAVRIEDAGFEIRDMIAWCYGSGFPKSLDVSKAIDKAAGFQRDRIPGGQGGVNNILGTRKCGEAISDQAISGEAISDQAISGEAGQWSGWGTALKPALEPITMARKPFKGTVANNVLEHGTGAINVDGCRVATTDTYSYPNGAGGNGFHGGVGRPSDGSRTDTPCMNKAGRWPANLIHDGSDEVVNLFPQTGVSKGGNSTQINVGSGRYNWNNGETQKTPDGVDPGYGDSGSAARFFYCSKASKSERGLENNHPTVKPVELMRYLCRLITPPNGIVLDPFMGSGSTGKAALLEGFGFIGIEMDENYFHIAEKRINEVKNTPSLENFFG